MKAAIILGLLLTVSTALGQPDSTGSARGAAAPDSGETALDPAELELLGLPVKSSIELELAWFNERIDKAAARGETWILDPVETALRFIEAPSAPFTNVACARTPLESPRRAVVTIIRGNFADDSLRATWHRVELRRLDFGRWALTGARRAYLCGRGPQADFFAADLCP